MARTICPICQLIVPVTEIQTVGWHGRDKIHCGGAGMSISDGPRDIRLVKPIQSCRYIDSLCSLALIEYEIVCQPDYILRISWYMGSRDVRPLTCISICWSRGSKAMAAPSRYLPPLSTFDDRVPEYHELCEMVRTAFGAFAPRGEHVATL